MGCGTGRDAAYLHAARPTRARGPTVSEAMLRTRPNHPGGPDYVRADLRELRPRRGAAWTPSSAWTAPCSTATPTPNSTASCGPAGRSLTPGGLLVAEMRNGAFFLGRTELLDAPSPASPGRARLPRPAVRRPHRPTPAPYPPLDGPTTASPAARAALRMAAALPARAGGPPEPGRLHGQGDVRHARSTRRGRMAGAEASATVRRIRRPVRRSAAHRRRSPLSRTLRFGTTPCQFTPRR